jgi:NADH-quinone oxidoreductase subunit K
MRQLLESGIFIVEFINLAVILFLLGLFGIIVLRRNLIMIIISLELILLATNLIFIVFSIYLDDMMGQLFSIFILALAGAESSVGLAILVAYHRILGVLSLTALRNLKG